MHIGGYNKILDPPQNLGVERCKLEKLFEKVKIIQLFVDIFWDILNKMKDNLGQECVKGELLSFQDKTETIAPDFPGKMTVFSTFDLTFPPACPKI